MKYRHIFGWRSVWPVFLLVLLSQPGYTQTEGFITPLGMDAASVQEALPPGAVYEGAQVRHVIAPQENLHILAAYYYDDPRQWQRIYRENRNVIRNPNRLPAGQTLYISVGESWQPTFPYQEWLQLAHRNGLWQPGQWQRAAATDGQAAVPAVQGTPPPERRPTTPPSPVVQTPAAAEPPAPQTPPVAETPPMAEETPTAAPTPQETPTEQPEATQTPAETPTEAPETEQAPAF